MRKQRSTLRWLSFVCLLSCLMWAWVPPLSPPAAAEPAAPADTPTKLATTSVQTMTSNGTDLFWTVRTGGEFCPTDGEPAINSIPLGGSSVTTLYHSCSFHPYQIAADASHVYFADWDSDQIKRVAVSGGTPTVVASGTSLILFRGLALDDTYVYWGDWDGIKRAPKAGGTVDTLASTNASTELAVDGTHVYWTSRSGDAVLKVAKGGGTAQTLASGLDDPYGIAIDGTQVYFTEIGSGKVYYMGKDGSGLTAYFASPVTPYMAEAIGVNSTLTVWTDTTSLKDARVRRVDKGGGTVQNVALGLMGPADMWLTETYIYWGDSDGIWRVPTGASELKVDFSITDIEVTQGIQCLDNSTGDTTCSDNSVQLVADRPTYVRVYPKVTLSDTPSVTARLTGTRNGSPLPGSPIDPVDNSVYVLLAGADRESTSDSFNFLLPKSWRSGTVTLQAEINPGTAIPESNTGNNLSSQATVTFESARNLSVAYVPVKYTWSGWTGSSTPILTGLPDNQHLLRALMPYSQINFVGWTSGTPFASSVVTESHKLIDQLNKRYLATTNPPDQVFGFLPSGSWNNGLSDPTWISGGSGHVAAGDVNLTPAIMPHEIGHNLGRRHQTCFDGASDWPYGNTVIDIREVGFDVYRGVARAASTPDVMTGGNCSNSELHMWISPWNWNQLVDGTIDWAPAPNEVQAGPTAIVSGWLTEAGGELSPLLVLPEALPPTPGLEGIGYCITFRDGADGVLWQSCFDAEPTNCAMSGPSTGCAFGIRLEMPAGTERVQLTRGITLLDELVLSANAPLVEVIAPNGGETWNATHIVEWTASDPDGDPLTYDVLYSPDAGTSWESLASAVTETTLEVDSANLPGTSEALVRVVASDGLRSAEDTSDEVFTVALHPPVAEVIGPENGQGFEPGELIVLHGSAHDREEGTLTGDNLSWDVTGLGEVGTGTETSLRIYAAGTYSATLTASDSSEMTGEDTVVIHVGPSIQLMEPEHTINISDTAVLEIMADALVDVYGYQLEFEFDPAVVEVQDAYDFVDGVQVEEGDFLPSPVTILNAADNTAGTISLVMTLQGAQPGISGSGVLGRITFHAKAPGVSEVRFTRVILSDPFSVQIPANAGHGLITVLEPTGDLSGRVVLERRASQAGSEVCAGTTCVAAAADGSYTLPDLPVGTHTIYAVRGSYLRSWREATVVAGQTLALPDVTLLGGDVNGDDLIGLVDGGEVGLAWNTTPASPNWSGAADITDDGTINVLDAVAVNYNWLQVAPGSWAGAMAADAGPREAYQGLMVPEATTRVIISPTLATASGVGETVELQIWVEDVERMYGGHVNVEFDPAVLRVRDTDPRPSAPGVQVRPGDFMDLVNRFELVNRADNSAGTIEYAVTQLNPAEARTGSGVLATIVFEGRWPGNSPVHISLVELIDDTRPTPQLIPASTQDGEVTVEEGWPLYLPVILRNG